MKTPRPILLTWSKAGFASGAEGRRYMIESSGASFGRTHRVLSKLEGGKHWIPWATAYPRYRDALRAAERIEFSAVRNAKEAR